MALPPEALLSFEGKQKQHENHGAKDFARSGRPAPSSPKPLNRSFLSEESPIKSLNGVSASQGTSKTRRKKTASRPSSVVASTCSTCPNSPRSPQLSHRSAETSSIACSRNASRSSLETTSSGVAWSSFGADVRRGSSFGCSSRECLSPRKIYGPAPGVYRVERDICTKVGGSGIAPGIRFPKEPRRNTWLFQGGLGGPGTKYNFQPPPCANARGFTLNRTPRMGCTTRATKELEHPDEAPGPCSYIPQCHASSTFR